MTNELLWTIHTNLFVVGILLCNSIGVVHCISEQRNSTTFENHPKFNKALNIFSCVAGIFYWLISSIIVMHKIGQWI